MTDKTNEGQEGTSEERSLTVTRVIEAPSERVYDAFLDPDELSEWLPPDGFSAEIHEFESEVGGTFRMTFNAETDELEPYSHTFYGQYEELSPGERIVYTQAFESDDPGMAGETTTTVTFEEITDGTEVTVRQSGIPEGIPAEDAEEGWNNSLDNLTHLIAEQ